MYVIPRSFLYCSALNTHHFSKSQKSDVVVIDLEDAVPPKARENARLSVADFFCRPLIGRFAIRINSLRSNDGLMDLLFINSLIYKPEFIIVAMAESASDVDIIRANLMQNIFSPKILVTVETPQCLKHLYEIAPRTDGLIFGSADYAANLGVPIGEWSSMLHARSAIVAAAAFANIPAFDTAYFILGDLEGLEVECKLTRQLGFTGKTAVHPEQVSTINQAFTPSSVETQTAMDIISVAEGTEEKITRLNQLMVGPPFVKQAKKIIDRVQNLREIKDIVSHG
jgi:(S)-citramalyl-CoA lyase